MNSNLFSVLFYDYLFGFYSILKKFPFFIYRVLIKILSVHRRQIKNFVEISRKVDGVDGSSKKSRSSTVVIDFDA